MEPVELGGAPRFAAAQYLRASSEHQQFSTAIQSQAIALYAIDHNFEVVQTYADEASSGLVLRYRPGLQQLLRDVVSGTVPYQAILVYDVSRWGRFLDTDESAHYEFLCKSSGVPVHYCAEIFGNESTLPNLIMKAIKRSMAGEYSRELSIRVRRGMERIVRSGFRGGGRPGYGLRRRLVAADGRRKQELVTSERKNLSSDRVVLELGSNEEVRCIREIYAMYTNSRLSDTAIAKALNVRDVPGPQNAPWTHHEVRAILTKPKYAGIMVYNRTTQYLKGAPQRRPESEWIVVPNAIEAAVDVTVFKNALAIRQSKTRHKSNEQVLEDMRSLLKQREKLSIRVLAEHPQAPSQGACRARFGSLAKMYELIGYQSKRSSGVALRNRLYEMRASLMENLLSLFPGQLALASNGSRWRTSLRHISGLQISVRVCRYWCFPTGLERWTVEHHANENSFMTLLAFLDSTNSAFEQLFMLPQLHFRSKMYLTRNDARLDSGKSMNDLNQFLTLFEQMIVARETD